MRQRKEPEKKPLDGGGGQQFQIQAIPTEQLAAVLHQLADGVKGASEFQAGVREELKKRISESENSCLTFSGVCGPLAGISTRGNTGDPLVQVFALTAATRRLTREVQLLLQKSQANWHPGQCEAAVAAAVEFAMQIEQEDWDAKHKGQEGEA